MRPRASGFVNAVLRRYLRERKAIDTRVMKHAVGRYAHPRWLIEGLQQDWPGDFERMLDAGNEPPPMWLRVNERKQDVDACQRSLATAGLVTERSPFVPTALRLAEAAPVELIPGFTEGAVSVQDAGAQLAALLLDAHPAIAYSTPALRRAARPVTSLSARPVSRNCWPSTRMASVSP